MAAVPLSPPAVAMPAAVADGASVLAGWSRPGRAPRVSVASWSGGAAPPRPTTIAAAGTLLDLHAAGGDALALVGRGWATAEGSLLAVLRRGGRWGAPVRLDRTAEPWSLREAVGAVTVRRVAVVAWIRQHPVLPAELRVRETAAGGGTRTRLMARVPRLDEARIVAAPDGSVVLAWDAGGDLRMAVRRPDGAWTAPRQLTATGSPLALAAGRTGRPLLVWTSFAPARGWTVRAGDVGADGALVAVRRLPPGVAPPVAAAVGSGGRAIVAWRGAGGRRGRTVVVRAIARGPGAHWAATVTLSRPWRIPAPDSDPVAAWAGRRAVVAWGRLGAVEARVRRDGRWSPPRRLVGSRQVPASVTAALALGRRAAVVARSPAAGGAGPLLGLTVPGRRRP